MILKSQKALLNPGFLIDKVRIIIKLVLQFCGISYYDNTLQNVKQILVVFRMSEYLGSATRHSHLVTINKLPTTIQHSSKVSSE